MEVIKKEQEYPLHSIAVNNVLDAFEADGYGLIITHLQLKEWMGIREPTTIEDVKKSDLDYLKGMQRVKNELLEGANIYLDSVIGIGYKILHPEDQIRKGADQYLEKSKRALRSMAKVLANVDRNLLCQEGKALQIEKINRLAFLKNSFRRRNFKKIE